MSYDLNSLKGGVIQGIIENMLFLRGGARRLDFRSHNRVACGAHAGQLFPSARLYGDNQWNLGSPVTP